MLKVRRCDQAVYFIVALCFSGGFTLTREIVRGFGTDKLIARLQITLYVVWPIAFVYAVVRVPKMIG